MTTATGLKVVVSSYMDDCKHAFQVGGTLYVSPEVYAQMKNPQAPDEETTAFRQPLRANPLDRTTRLVYADWLQDRDRERDAALQRILADPQDDAPRLLYAAACERAGDAERAEFIRAQCWCSANPSCGSCTGDEWLQGKPCSECDTRDGMRAKVTIPLFSGARWRDWSGPARALIPNGAQWDDHLQFRRGFVASFTCTSADFIAHAEAIREAHPLEAVRLTTLPDIYPGGSSITVHMERMLAALGERYPGIRFEWPGLALTLPG